ncbi:MAG: 30S ribosomal protein S17 [Candidatus Lambdaproteobacteria bacterium RIFOXYD1_FULL_56_27]|uniref:Small ribosomal subunit protein uS17 n=1 Tax=Candidatus Lambdaproteobacteria bacterium RIFOXYD2_FULL_56_26 TaxID=1817773 RepID=A0A1F6GMP4_9PROT|nr:MAG: 30S ribosomal protein S17 [Candidatus Lambdaproteobacteria bacterium RIFOXYD2_FULL_56_26]OGH05635.1 MAG: 30S ribosomal protein S17 [Candidatus Lambdaproteobacteria bacterium RIFOXYC1_FULL_56_13]OGH08595.1 MAG: 30S ribosomal protein S17 [Candidatus Lambdaproteobacteria bacterium RIFOXYD1_FULL_56_27]
MSETIVTERRKKVLKGTVVSDKMEKTATVLVERTFQHPLYKRTVRKSKKYKIHDPNNECKIGDTVRLVECKPISKDKSWRLLEILERAV